MPIDTDNTANIQFLRKHGPSPRVDLPAETRSEGVRRRINILTTNDGRAIAYLSNEHNPTETINAWLETNKDIAASLSADSLRRRLRNAVQNDWKDTVSEVLDQKGYETDHSERGKVGYGDQECPLCGEDVPQLASHIPHCDGQSDPDLPDVSESRMTTERFFGGVDGRLEVLTSSLEFVAAHTPTEGELMEWIIDNTPANTESTVRRNIAFLETIDLVDRTSNGIVPTNKGSALHRHEDPLVIYEGLATGVDGFREIVRTIISGTREFGEIQAYLRQSFPDYTLPDEVVKGHLNWLQSLELIQEIDGEYEVSIESGSFEVGQRYSRWFIHDVFAGGRYSGISTPSKHPYIFIFTGDSGNAYGYEDEFLVDGSFLYTGEGAEGDMQMNRGNRAIRDHKSNGKSIHLFEDTDLPWIVSYVGEYEYHSHKTDSLPDEDGELREAFRFRLEPIGGTEVQIDEGPPSKLSDEQLFEKAKQSSPTRGESPGSTGSSDGGRSYPRSQIVHEFALRMADGTCQGCFEDAPFVKEDGTPFLEVHHITRRSDGGADDPENVIAVCPNCHRRVHEGRDGEEFNQRLADVAADRNKEFNQ